MKTHHSGTVYRQYIQMAGTAAAVLFAGLWVSGCATSGYKQADKTGEGIAEFREEVISAREAVDMSLDGIRDITAKATTDPRAAYETFAKSVEGVADAGAKASKRAADMKAAGQAYFQQWQDQLATIQNPEIRQLAMERKETLSKSFETMSPLLETAKTRFQAYLSDLRDLQTFLGNDLTVQGVNAAKTVISKTLASGTETQTALNNLVAELNTISATLTPARMPESSEPAK